MARKLRLQYPGAVYPVMNRGDRREAIFRDAKDYACFLQTLAEACAKARWQVPAWCLVPNYFHLVLETPQPTLVAGMKWLLGTYTEKGSNRRTVRFISCHGLGLPGVEAEEAEACIHPSIWISALYAVPEWPRRARWPRWKSSSPWAGI